MKQSSELSKYYVDNKYVFKIIDHLEYQISIHFEIFACNQFFFTKIDHILQIKCIRKTFCAIHLF